MKPVSITVEYDDTEQLMPVPDRKYLFKATWQAMFRMHCDGFPKLLAHVHPIAAPFILWQLKGKGYSNCRVVAEADCLIVYADR